jgi:hypothetical protein
VDPARICTLCGPGHQTNESSKPRGEKIVVMTENEKSIRSRLGIPSDAKYVVILDQSAHLDWDWNRNFWQDFVAAGNGTVANGLYLQTLKLLNESPSSDRSY